MPVLRKPKNSRSLFDSKALVLFGPHPVAAKGMAPPTAVLLRVTINMVRRLRPAPMAAQRNLTLNCCRVGRIMGTKLGGWLNT